MIDPGRPSRNKSNGSVQLKKSLKVSRTIAHENCFKVKYEDPFSKVIHEHSFLDVEEIMQAIIKQAGKTLAENHLLLKIPNWCMDELFFWTEKQIQAEFIAYDTKDCEQLLQGIHEDQEPQNLGLECWQSFKVEVNRRSTRVAASGTSSQLQKKRISKGVFQSKISLIGAAQTLLKTDKTLNTESTLANDIILTTEKDDSIAQQIRLYPELSPEQEDHLENGLRQAYERELSLKQQKEIIEHQRIEEYKEHQKQLKNMQGNLNAKRNFTFDFEGKILIQQPLSFDKMPPYNEAPQFTILNQGGLSPRKEPPLKPIGNLEKQRKEIQTQTEILKAAPSTNQIQHLVVNKGVTLVEGANRKQGPNYITEVVDLDESIGNPQSQLKLSREQYLRFIKKTQKPNFDSSLIIKLNRDSNHQVQTTQPAQISQIDSTISKDFSFQKQTKVQNLNSISYSIYRGSHGQIKYSETSSVIIEDLAVEQETFKLTHRKASLPKVIKSPNELFQIDLLKKVDWGVPKEPRPNGSVKLPLKVPSTHSLPILNKNPRDRLTQPAQMNFMQSKYLPPPMVGNSVGHNYKGYRL